MGGWRWHGEGVRGEVAWGRGEEDHETSWRSARFLNLLNFLNVFNFLNTFGGIYLRIC